MLGDSTNWVVSSVLALGLHGGLLFAFADQIGATVAKKPQTEITLLDLPSISAPATITAKPVVKLQPRKIDTIKPAKTPKPERLKNSNSSNKIQKLAKPPQELLKNSKKARAIEKLKTATSNQPAKAQVTDKKLLPVEANKNVPIAKKAEDKKIRAPAAKTIAPVLAKARSKPVISAKRPVEKLGNRNKIVEKPTASAPVKLALATPKKLLPFEANKTVTVAKKSAKIIIKNKEHPITSKANTAALFKPKPKLVSSKRRPPEKLVNQRKPILKIAPSNKSKPVQNASARKTAKLAVKNSRITAPVINKTFTPNQVSSRPLKSIASNTSKLQKLGRSKDTQKIAAAPITRVPPLRKTTATPTRITSQPKKINKVNSRSAPAKLSSRNRRLTTTKPKRLTKPAKKNIQIAKVKIRKNATRVRPVERIRKPVKQPPPSAPSKQPEQLAMITRPNPIPDEIRPAPTKNQIEDFGKVLKFLKFHKSENKCFLALPSISNSERMELTGFSNEKSSWPRFQKAVSESTRFNIPGHLNSISDAQCQVMVFARQNNLYPSFSTSIKVDRAKIANGGIVTGKLYVGKGRYFYFYVVDDEGTAINVNKFVKTEENNTIFKLQINLTGGRVTTSQLLLAIVTDLQLASTRFPDPIPVNSLLKNIQNEITDKNISLDLALSAFTVD